MDLNPGLITEPSLQSLAPETSMKKGVTISDYSFCFKTLDV